jgi:hypothetical protein
LAATRKLEERAMAARAAATRATSWRWQPRCRDWRSNWPASAEAKEEEQPDEERAAEETEEEGEGQRAKEWEEGDPMEEGGEETSEEAGVNQVGTGGQAGQERASHLREQERENVGSGPTREHAGSEKGVSSLTSLARRQHTEAIKGRVEPK